MTYRDLFEEENPESKDKNTKIIERQLEMGKKVEHEHQPTYDFLVDYVSQHNKMPPSIELFKRIALDHLHEYQLYYTGLAKMEKELSEAE